MGDKSGIQRTITAGELQALTVKLRSWMEAWGLTASHPWDEDLAAEDLAAYLGFKFPDGLPGRKPPA